MSTGRSSMAMVGALVLLAGSASATPQRSTAPAAAGIVFVGVGAGDGVVIRVGDAVVLSDIGEHNIPFVYEAIDRALAKIDSRQIEAIILTHAHDDHVKNFALLLESRKYTVKRALLSRNLHWGATDANRAVMSDPPPPRPSQVCTDGGDLPLRRSEVDDPQPGQRCVQKAPPSFEQLGGLRARGERKAAPLHR